MNAPISASHSSRQFATAGYDSQSADQQQQSDYELKQQSITQQYCCAFCKRIAIKPISLICNHSLCLECGNFLKEQEQETGVQPKYRLSCPACQSNTVTYNVKNLLIQAINEKTGNEIIPLRILSLQTSPGSKQNLRKSSLNQLQFNGCGNKSRDTSITQETCYNVKTVQDTHHIMQQYQNSKQTYSQDIQNQSQRLSNSLSKLTNQNQFTDKTLALSTSQSAIKNQSLGTPFSNTKKNNYIPIQNSPQDVNNQLSQYSNNIMSEPQFFTKESGSNNSNILLKRNSCNINSYVNCLNNMFSNSSNNLGEGCQNKYACDSNKQISQQIQAQSQQILQDFQNSQSGLEINRNVEQKTDQLKCNQHNEQYTLFCQTDKTLLCLECLYSQKTHKNHNIIPLKNATSILKKENDEFKNQSEVYLKKLQDSIQISKQNQITLNREYLKCSQKVNEIFDSMVAAVNSRRDKLLEQLEQSYRIHLNDVENQYNELENIKNILEEYKNFDEQIAENAYSESYIFSAFKMIQQSLQQTNLDQKPIKVNFNITQIENSHKQLFNKLLEKIVQLQSSKPPEERLNQTKQSKTLESNSFSSNYTLSTKQSISNNYIAYAPPTQSSNLRDPTPKKQLQQNSNLKNTSQQSRNNNQQITNTATSSQNVTQRGNSIKQSGYSSQSYSEKVQKRLNTQASSKVSYKNIKRKLSTDFNTVNTSSKENIHVYPQYQHQVKLNTQIDVKKRSNSMVVEDILKSQQVRQSQDIKQIYDLNFDQQQTRQPLNCIKNEFQNQCNDYYYGNLFIKENFNQNNYQTAAKDTTVNTTNISLNRSPFKEYIIN